MRHHHPIALGCLLLSLGFGGAAPAQPIVFTLEAESAETFGKPHDIVLSPDGKALYVADNDNDRIVVLDPRTLRELAVFAEGEVGAPHDVDFDPMGRLNVADTRNNRIAIYEIRGEGRQIEGRLVAELGGPVRWPEGVVVHEDGRVFATGARSGNLVVYDNGEVVGEAGGFSSPHDVEIGPDGGIWVADAANDRMVRLNEALKETTVYTGAPYAFNGPRYMDFDASGRLFVADKYTHQIKIISRDGELLQVLGEPSAGKGNGVFDRPEGVEIRGDQIWLSDTYNDRIVRYRMTEGAP